MTNIVSLEPLEKKFTRSWITKSVSKLLQYKDKLRRKLVFHGTDELQEKYKKVRNQTLYEIRKLKRQFYDKKIDKCQRPYEFFKVFNKFSGKSKSTAVSVDLNELNEIFVGVGETLAANFQNRESVEVST